MPQTGWSYDSEKADAAAAFLARKRKSLGLGRGTTFFRLTQASCGILRHKCSGVSAAGLLDIGSLNSYPITQT
jgi:hypothetical protein